MLQRPSRSLPHRFHARNVLAVLAPLLLPATALAAGSLHPTRAGLERQAAAAQAEGFSYLRNDAEVHDFVRRGLLVTMRGNGDYHLHQGVRHGVARPEVKLFVERLARQYRAACGERLVVTSLLRPTSRQPSNSHPLSVHPTGMALDLRVSPVAKCRGWLERTLVDLEGRGVLEAARERNPPHYHVVVFPTRYASYVAGKGSGTTLAAHRPTSGKPPVAARAARYRVRSGDSLWAIARRHGVSVAALQRSNGLRGNRLRPGQQLTIPAR